MYLHEATEQDRQDEVFSLRLKQTRTLQPRPGAEPDSSLVPLALRDAGVPANLVDWKLTKFGGKANGVGTKFIEMFDGEMNFHPVPGHYGEALVGVPDTGKTSLAAAMLRYAVSRGSCVRFITAESFAKFHTTWIELNQNAKSYDDYADRADTWRRELWRMLQVYEFLVLDDIGRTKVPEFVIGEIHVLLRDRVANGCFTILTSNLTITDFETFIDNSAADFVRREFQTTAFVKGDVIHARQ